MRPPRRGALTRRAVRSCPRARRLAAIEPSTRYDLTYPVAIVVPRVRDIAVIQNFAV